jgi:hypothetical protein
MPVFLLGFAAFFFLSPTVSAQSPDPAPAGLRLVTSPLPINLSTAPGTSISTEIKVKNAGTQEERLKISVMKFKAYQDSGQPALMDPEPGDDFLRWLSLSEPEFTVAPNEWRTVQATFQVPESAAFSYYYALVISRANEQPAQNQQTVLQGGTAILVLLEAKVPGAKREVMVKEFSVDRGFYEFLPATFRIGMENTGNVHLAPRGNIFISQNGEKGNVLPESTRTFETLWEDGFPVYKNKITDGNTERDAEGNIVKKLTWNWNDASKLRFGKYTAKLVLVYDDGNRDVPIESEVTFWVVPWRGLIVLFVVAIFFFVGLRSTLRSLWNKIFRRKQKTV